MTAWRRNSLRIRLAACGLAACACLTMEAHATEIWVVTDRAHPVKATAGVRVIMLDTPTHILRELSARLPADPKRAAAIVEQRLRRSKPGLQGRMAAAYQDITDAWRLGVTKIPAVIVDQRYVVYGETHVPRAVAWIAEFRRTHP